MRTRIASAALAVVSLSLLGALRPWGQATHEALASGTGDGVALSGSIPGSLEELLEAALRSNPDVIVAEAKVREAEAELNQARLQVTQQVVTSYNLRDQQKTAVGLAAENLKNAETQLRVGRGSPGELTKAHLARITAETALAQNEAQLRYLLGMGGRLRAEFPLGERSETAPPATPALQRPEIPDRFRTALDSTMVSLKFQEASLSDVFQFLQNVTSDDLAFVLDRSTEITWDEERFSLNLPKPLPLRAALTAILDQCSDPGMCIVFRDYGLFVTSRDNAALFDGASLPPGVPLLPPEER